MQVNPDTTTTASAAEKPVLREDDRLLEFLICQPHDFFGFSVFELLEIDRQAAIGSIVKRIGPQQREIVEKYFAIIDRLRDCGRLPTDFVEKH